MKTLRCTTSCWGETTVAYEARGEGPPLLLVHGFPLSHAMWQHQIEGLVGTFRVLAPDLPGFGASPWPEGSGVRGEGGQEHPPRGAEPVLSMPGHAETLNAVLDALAIDRPVIFCGLSMGGYIAWPMLERYADRIAGLILCDTRAASDTPAQADERLRTARRILAEGTEPLAEAMIPKLFAPQTRQRAPQLVAATRDVIVHTDRRTVAAALRGMAVRPDATDQLGSIACPTLLIVGEEDGLSPPETMQPMARAIPDARCVVVPDAGHLAPLENPSAVNRAILHFAREKGLVAN